MKLNKPTAEFYIPSKENIIESINKTTHMSIAAHQDDIEIMAYDGILKCYQKADKWFTGVVVTNGAGSMREGKYISYTDKEMKKIRNLEQKKASEIGEYGLLALLDYSSFEAKDPKNKEIVKELSKLIKLARPDVLYTHNLADKHDTHLGVAIKVIEAIRNLDKEYRPKKLYGCEVWRDLEWMVDSEKIIFDVSGNPELALSIISVFESQIIEGKRYDLATIGRRLANATYLSFQTVNESDAIIYAMDLTPLIIDDSIDVITYITSYISRFEKCVFEQISNVIKKN